MKRLRSIDVVAMNGDEFFRDVMRKNKIIYVLLVSVLFTACNKQEPEKFAKHKVEKIGHVADSMAKPEDAIDNKGMQIAWIKDDVEGAFRAAKEQDTPMLLYWGAEWCPPCQQLKATVFKQPSFIEKTRKFLPVYIDGDTESAQRWGERFGVKGYPTVIIFNPEGNEIARIAHGLNAERFNSALDAVLNRLQPVQVILQRVLSEPGSATEADYSLLAYYAWQQDTQGVMPEGQQVEIFGQLQQQVPPRLDAIAARLFLSYLEAAARVDPYGDLLLELGNKRTEYIERLLVIFENERLRREISQWIIFSSEEIAGFLTPAVSDDWQDDDNYTVKRQQLVTAWIKAAQALVNDTGLSTAERLGALLPIVQFAEQPDGKPPVSLQQSIREQVGKADLLTPDPRERQTVMSRASYVMFKAGMVDEARAILEAEIDKALKPFYFMLRLSRLEKEAGNTEKALAWLDRAYTEAEGRATRFQWGVNYITGLIEMTPKDAVHIEKVATEVLQELMQHGDAMHGRNRKRLATLESTLKQWGQQEHARELENIRNTVIRQCQKLDTNETCKSFLLNV